MEKPGVEKIKIIGDAYMVIAGAPESNPDRAALIARLALTLLGELDAIRHETGLDIDLRVGIHSGPVIAGVIGRVRFSYDVWGDTVNTASRMESHGEPGRIQVSETVFRCLDGPFRFSERGLVEIKGKGTMHTWWQEGGFRLNRGCTVPSRQA